MHFASGLKTLERMAILSELQIYYQNILAVMAKLSTLSLAVLWDAGIGRLYTVKRFLGDNLDKPASREISFPYHSVFSIN